MVNLTKGGFLVVIAFSALVAGQNKEETPKHRPAPEMQRLAKMLIGTWKVVEDYAPGVSMPKGGKGTAQSVIRQGPGGFSLIEDFVSTLPVGHLHAVYWWDPAAGGLRTLDCNDVTDEGCVVEDGIGRWDGSDFVTLFKIHEEGKTIPAKIVWAEKDSRSFTATMYIADASGTLKRDWTFLHTRVK
jgi:hypothetical protein